MTAIARKVGVKWLTTDARGWRLGLAPASDEHRGRVDIVAQTPTGHVVLARLAQDQAEELAIELTEWWK